MVSKLRIIRKQTVEVEDPFQNFVMREVDTGAEERFSHLNLACQLPRRRQDKNTRPVCSQQVQTPHRAYMMSEQTSTGAFEDNP